MPFPDYTGHSIVNLMSSIGQNFARTNEIYPLCQPLQGIDLSAYQNVILLIIDGMGHRYVNQSQGLFQAHCHAQLTSVFPSTTATSITAFMTGLAPQQHGLTGWFTYLDEIPAVTAVLPFRERGADHELTERGFDLASLYQHPVFFNELDADCFVVSENWILTTAFNRAHTGKAQTRGYDSLPDMFSCIESIVKQGRKKQYIYAYWSQFDHLSHKHGNQSDEVAAHYSVLQQETEKMLKHIQGSNTLLLLSADHGFIDTSPQHCITVNEHARLQNCLSQPLSGEPRAAYCYVHEAKRHEFVDYMNTHFAMQLDCIPSAALLQQNVFGLGEAHPKLHQRIGDFTLIMKDNFIIKDWLESENYFFHYGVHGGVSELEMYVPLVLLEA